VLRVPESRKKILFTHERGMNTTVDNILIFFDRPFCLLMISPPKTAKLFTPRRSPSDGGWPSGRLPQRAVLQKKNTTQNNICQSANLQLLCKLCNPSSQHTSLDDTTKFTSVLLYSHIEHQRVKYHNLLSQLKCRMHCL